MNIEELFEKYKEISLNIIPAIGENDLEKLDNLLLERSEILKEISKSNQTKEDLKKLYEEYDLAKIDEDMKQKFDFSLNEVKQELLKIQKRKQASQGYNSINAKAVYLSKKI